MKYHYLDMNAYKRKKHFEYFSTMAYPYVSVTVNVDITEFLTEIKQEKFSFFLSFCYCAAKAADSVPEFRQRIQENKIIEYDRCRTSHTVFLEDGTYCYCMLDYDKSFEEYLRYAVRTQENAKQEKSVEDKQEDLNELIFIFTLPWFSYTALNNPVPIPADSNPRITWGKYIKEDLKTVIPVTVQCNHALVDGVHISQFLEALKKELCKVTESVRKQEGNK